MATTNKNEDEWLQFMEFIRRKYGNNSSDFIRINDYNSRSSKSVAEYYKQKYPTPTADININDNLEKLLKNASFIGLFNLNDPVEIPRFTEIYSETDSLMQKLRLNNSPQDDLYIRCNPTDDTEGNGFLNESTTASNGAASNGAASNGAATSITTPEISLANISNNVGFNVLISVLILAVVFFIGFIFTNYLPTNTINRLSTTTRNTITSISRRAASATNVKT